MVRILVADDRPLLRAGIKTILTREPDFQIVAEAGSTTEVTEFLEKQPIDVVVLGINLNDGPSLEALREIRRAKPNLPVLIVSIHAADLHAVRLIRAGASGYLAKSSPPEELIEATRRIAAGKRHLSESIAEMLAEAIANPGRGTSEQAPHEALSDRELQVVCFIASGKSVSQIAAAMRLSVKTVSTYRTRALEKMHMGTNAELTRYAIQNRLVD